MSEYDVNGLFEFLSQTPESGLRKMLVDQKPMTEVHFNLLLKVLRSGKVTDFIEHFEKQDFPKIKMTPAETKLKEKFWPDCISTFKNRGILGPALPQKAA